MAHLAQLMRKLASTYQIAFLTTNHTVAIMGGDNALKPALGETWSYVPATQIFLSFPNPSLGLDSSYRYATLHKSSRKPCGLKAAFVISECGLCGVMPEEIKHSHMDDQ